MLNHLRKLFNYILNIFYPLQKPLQFGHILHKSNSKKYPVNISDFNTLKLPIMDSETENHYQLIMNGISENIYKISKRMYDIKFREQSEIIKNSKIGYINGGYWAEALVLENITCLCKKNEDSKFFRKGVKYRESHLQWRTLIPTIGSSPLCDFICKGCKKLIEVKYGVKHDKYISIPINKYSLLSMLSRTQNGDTLPNNMALIIITTNQHIDIQEKEELQYFYITINEIRKLYKYNDFVNVKMNASESKNDKRTVLNIPIDKLTLFYKN